MPDVIFAIDRSVRRRDADGRLHVALTNISKATVNPYYGREIPGAAALGLRADEIYQILRDPEALKLGAPTFNNVPLLDEHVIVSVNDPKKGNVVGSTGTDAMFDGEYLRNSLVVWDAEAIARIESGEQKEISCAYRYVAVKVSGTHKGLPYSLVMRDIQANHVALVREGRAGPDVVVADGKLGEVEMKFSVVKAKFAEKIALDSALNDTDRKRLIAAFDAMEEEMGAEDEDKDDEKKAEDEDGEEEKEVEARDKKARDKKAKDKRAKDKAAKDKAAKDAEKDEDCAEDEDDNDKDDKKAEDEDKEKAMDAAIKKATDRAVAETVAKMENLQKAKDDVAPLVGVVHGLDSAEAVYRFALDSASVPHKDIKEVAALKQMVAMLPKPGSLREPLIAQDSKTRGSVVDLFPGLGRYA